MIAHGISTGIAFDWLTPALMWGAVIVLIAWVCWRAINRRKRG